MPRKVSLGRIDPLVRLLLLAIVLASVLPVSERWRGLAQAVSNSAVFLLFLLNGLRLPRAEIIRGIGNVRFLMPLVAWCFGAMALAGWALSLLVEPWLPLAGNFTEINVESETADPTSMLSLYRKLLQLRKVHDALSVGAYAPVATSGDLLAYIRGRGDSR